MTRQLKFRSTKEGELKLRSPSRPSSSREWVRYFNAQQTNSRRAKLGCRKLFNQQTRLHLSADVNEDEDISVEDEMDKSPPAFTSRPPVHVISSSDDTENDEKECRAPTQSDVNERQHQGKRRRLKRNTGDGQNPEQQENEDLFKQRRSKNKQALQALLEKSKSKQLSRRRSIVKEVHSNDSSDTSMNSYVDENDSEDFVVEDGEESSGKDSPENPYQVKEKETIRTEKGKLKKEVIHSTFHDSSSASKSNDEPDESQEDEEEDWREEMPTEFSSSSMQSLAQMFNVLIQLLASEVLEPGFIESTYDEKDSYFLVPLRKLDALIGSRKTSLCLSAAWKPEFKESLETYPGLRVQALPETYRPICDACQRSQRFASAEMILTGDPYDRRTLESLESDDLPRTVFCLGRFCQKRSSVYHQLHHYKWAMLQEVKAQVEVLEHRFKKEVQQQGPAFVVKRLLEDIRFLESVYHPFKNLIENVEQSYAAD